MASERFEIIIQAKGIGSAEAGMNRLGRSTQRADKHVNALRKSLAFLRNALVVVASVRVFGGLIRTLANFAQEMSTVRAISGATETQFKALREEAKRLGATTRFSATEAAQGMTFLARAGFNVQQVMAAIGPVLTLAQAGNLSLARAADIASNVLQAFGLQADQTTKIVDVLAKAANSSNTNVQQLGDALKLAAPVAAAFGQTVEQTSAAVGVLSNAGLQATLAGTGLRRVLAELENPNKKLTRLLKAAKLEARDVRISSVGLTKALQNLKDSGIDPASYALQVFGQRGGPAFLNLIKNIPQLEELNKKLKESAGFALQTAKIMNDNLNGALLEVRSALENLLISFGDLGPESLLTSGFRALADILRTVAANLDRVIQVLQVLAVVVLPKLIAGTTLWVARLAKANKALFAITAAVSVVTALSAAFDDASTSVDKTGEKTRTFGQRVIDDFQTIGDFVSGAFMDIEGTATDVWTIISTGASKVWVSMQHDVQIFWTAFKSLAEDAINEVIKGLNQIRGVFNALAKVTGQEGLIFGPVKKVDLGVAASKKGIRDLEAEFDRLDKKQSVAALRIADRARIARRLREANQLANQNIVGGETARLAQINRPGAPKKTDNRGRRVDVGTSSSAADKLAKALDRVLGRTSSVRKAQLDLKNAQEVLTKAVAAGLISRKDAAAALALYKRRLEDALNPLGAVVRKINEERNLLKLSNEERSVESELLKIVNENKKKGVFFNEQEIGQLRELIRLRNEEKRVAQEREAIRDAITGPLRKYQDQQKALAQLQQTGNFTTAQLQDQARQIRIAFLNTQKDMFSGFERGFLKMEADVADAAKSTEELFNLAFKGATDAIVKFVETGKLEFGDLFRSIGKFLLELGLKQAFVGGGNLLGFGKGVSEGGAGAGGILGSLLGGLGGLLGFASGGSFTVGPQASLGTIPGQDNRLIAFRAQDGENVTVTPKNQNPNTRPVYVNFYITTPDADSFRRSQGQLMAQTSAALNRANARNN